MQITVNVNTERVREAFRRAPAVMRASLERFLSLAAREVAREAQRLAPKARSALWASIKAFRVGDLHWRVAPGVNYARAVEEGTGPAAGQRPYMPDPVKLMDYVKQRASIGFTARPGSAR